MAGVTVIVCLAFDHRAPADGLQTFKQCILNCSYVSTALEVCGTFDLIVQGSCESMAEFTENMERIHEPLARFVSRIETNFVGRTIERSSDDGESVSLWLPCEDGRRRVDAQLIDKIVAEGDYMRVHVGEWNCLVHETLERLSKQLEGCKFVRLHRSWLVRIDFLDRLIHRDQRWIARLLDGTELAVAKSHVKDALEIMSGNSSIGEGGSSIRSVAGEGQSRLIGNAMKISDE